MPTQPSVTRKRRRLRVVQEESATKISDEEEEDDDVEGSLTAADTPWMANFVKTVCTLWQFIEDRLAAEEECNQFLLDNLSGTSLPDALTHFEAKAAHCDETQEDCYRTCASSPSSCTCQPVPSSGGIVPPNGRGLRSLSTSAALT
jgi:hypothetical protein